MNEPTNQRFGAKICTQTRTAHLLRAVTDSVYQRFQWCTDQ